MFGALPVGNIVCHFLIMIAIAVACFVPNTLASVWEAGAIITGILWLIKLIGSCANRETGAFQNIRTGKQTNDFLKGLRGIPPTTEIGVECWHMEVYYTTDQNGHRTRHEKKVVSYTEKRFLRITGWCDKTGPMYVVGIDKASLIYLQLR